MTAQIEIDRYANLQPAIQIENARIVLDAMRERAESPGLSAQNQLEWLNRIVEMTRVTNSSAESQKSEHSVLDVIHLGEILIAVNQAGICWSYNICKWSSLSNNLFCFFAFTLLTILVLTLGF